MKKTIIAIASLCSALAAYATVSVDVKAYKLFNETESVEAPLGTLSYLIADVNGNGIGDLNNVDGSSFLFDASDVILGSATIGGSFNLAGYASVFAGALQHADDGGVLKTGDDVWLVWFPHIIGSSTVGGPGANQWFGAVNVTEITGNGGAATYNNMSFNQAAMYQSIPEPATALLALIGGGLAYMVRRKSNLFIS